MNLASIIEIRLRWQAIENLLKSIIDAANGNSIYCTFNDTYISDMRQESVMLSLRIRNIDHERYLELLPILYKQVDAIDSAFAHLCVCEVQWVPNLALFRVDIHWLSAAERNDE